MKRILTRAGTDLVPALLCVAPRCRACRSPVRRTVTTLTHRARSGSRGWARREERCAQSGRKWWNPRLFSLGNRGVFVGNLGLSGLRALGLVRSRTTHNELRIRDQPLRFLFGHGVAHPQNVQILPCTARHDRCCHKVECLERTVLV